MIDGRSLRGKTFSNNNVQIEPSTEQASNDITSSTQREDISYSHITLHDLNKSETPANLQPLLTFSSSLEQDSTQSLNEEDTKGSNMSDIECLSHQNDKHSRLLLNSAGNLRYFGESSPLSLLQECRFVFTKVIGISMFTDDPLKEQVIDEPNELTMKIPVGLPKRQLCNVLVEFFKKNINDTFYVFDMNYFKESIIERIYDNPVCAKQSWMCLFYLVLAIGALFAEITPSYQVQDLKVVSSAEFFHSSISFMRSLKYDVSLWMVEANFLRYFYYQSTCQRTSSWVHLGLSIRLAQALGLHRKVINEKFNDPVYVTHRRRLWRSLFICDRISSITLGRPLAANDYDWDDQGIHFIADPKENFRLKCQVEISKVAQINGRIVEHIYRDGIINMKRANELAIELKSWSLNLPREVDLDSTLEKFKSEDNEDNNLLMNVHMSQFYGIMLLCRPFFMYVMVRKLNSETNSEFTRGSPLLNFSKGCIKSSFLTIKLINYYTKNTTNILETCAAINGCLFASAILGLTLLEQIKRRQPDKEYINVLFDTLNISRKILYLYGMFNALSERWGTKIDDMLAALLDIRNSVTETSETISDSDQTDLGTFYKEIVSLDNKEISSNNLRNFQQTFVPSNTDMHSDTFMYSGDVAALNNNNQSLDVFMYDFGKINASNSAAQI